MKIALLLSAAAVALSADVVMAEPQSASPVLSGTYTVQLTELCQAIVNASTNPITHDLSGIAALNSGKMGISVGTVNFDPGTGLATVSMNRVNGSALVLNLLNGTEGQPMADLPLQTQTASYSNTSTLFTFNGTQYYAYYAAVSPGMKIAGSVVFGGLETTGCATSGTLTRQ